MIFDVAARSVRSNPVLIPVERLLGDSTGSRMPEADPAQLNFYSASRAVNACSTAALRLEERDNVRQLVMDYGECVGCGLCIEAGGGAMRLARKVAHCGVARAGLIRRWDVDNREECFVEHPAMDRAAREIRTLLGRALNIRQVDAGSCNGCEAEIGALTNPYYDLERFGIHFVASPKHADMLLVTGPVTRNMAEALKHTYEATPAPRLVVAVGACGCTGGVFAGSYAVVGAVDKVIPVDGFIPGCPPTPSMLITGILNVLIDKRAAG
jgi:Ni,Fe-hydrogenase III small subunit/NAD-dependent dihydropyrimidine dehydrogenase PreA subunit